MKKNKKLSKVWSKRHLPGELWPEILSRLPVKTLLRFGCVSKAWLSLIKDPDFCHLHLKNFKNNSDETHLLVVEGKQQKCVVRCSDSFETNPSLPKIDQDSFFYPDLGLGYDPMIKDYKHVKLIFRQQEMLHSVAIYTLGAGSWKIIQPKGSGFSEWQWDPEFFMNLPAYLQGSIYFIAQVPARFVSELVSFDLSNEAFCSTSLPENAFISSYEYNGPLTLVDGGRSPATCDFNQDLCIWVLETETMSWTKHYSFNLPEIPKLQLRYIKKNGDLLIWWGEKETSFRLLTSKELVQKWHLMSSYNLETKTEKIILQTKRRGFEIHDVWGYIESLIMLQ